MAGSNPFGSLFSKKMCLYKRPKELNPEKINGLLRHPEFFRKSQENLTYMAYLERYKKLTAPSFFVKFYEKWNIINLLHMVQNFTFLSSLSSL